MKSVKIRQDGSTRRPEAVNQLTVRNSAASNTGWMPEENTSLGEITITKNGEYLPIDIDAYAYYKVNVIVPGGNEADIEFTNPDGTTYVQRVKPTASAADGNVSGIVGTAEDGNDYLMKLDGNTIVRKEVPVRVGFLVIDSSEPYGYRNYIKAYDGSTASWYGGDVALLRRKPIEGVSSIESFSYGSSKWDNYVVTTPPQNHVFHISDGEEQHVSLYVKPYWLDNDLLLDSGYGLTTDVIVRVLPNG